MSKFLMSLMIMSVFTFGLVKMLHLQGNQIGLFFFFSLIVVWFFSGFSRKIRNNREYEKSPNSSGSYPNFSNQTAGIEWTKKKHLKSDKKDSVYIDEFTYSWETFKRFNLLHRLVFNSRTKNMYKEALAFTRGSLFIGSQGSGKTETINSLLMQKWYNRSIIHDFKGDFTEHCYDRRDIILNPFDKRGMIWDIFEESKKYPKIADSFFQSLLGGILGSSEQNKNFFTSSAKERFIKIFMEIQVQELSNKEKWQLFIKKIGIYFQEVEELNQKSEKDIVSTMKLLVEYLEYMNYLIQNGTKTFTISKFLRSNKKLFLLNNPTYSEFLTPYFSAFIDSFTKIFMAEMSETKDNLTLFLLDEYLSLLPLLSEESKTILHTLIRSKGGCMMPAIQYLPEDKKLKQQLLNSAENIYLFQTSDTSTAKEIKDIFGEVVYSSENRSESNNRDSGYQNSYSTAREYLLTDEILKEIGNDYSHITFTQSNQQLYKGYTKLLKRENKNKPFVMGSYIEFIEDKYKN